MPAQESAAEEETLETSSEQEAEFFRWWDGLSFPDLTKATFVKAATANSISRYEDAKTPVYEHAFLLADDEASFVLFTTDLREQAWSKTAPGIPEWDRVGHESEDLAGFVRAGVAGLRAHKG